MKLYETTKRSLVKTIAYRILIMTADGLIIFAITHRMDATIAVVVASNFSSTILYFLHERVWNKIHWGEVVVK